ncbi:MAG TPA: hypothetical protein VFU47_04260 [Armatimonadota bacterium]|nr:hypothetical protein [Armatimonadota bacterium]
MATHTGFRIGHILIQHGCLTEERLQEALAYQQETLCRLGQALLTLGFCTEVQIARAVAEQLGMPFVDLDETPPPPRLLQLLPRELAQRFGAIPVRLKGEQLVVVVRNPFDFTLDTALREALEKPLILACGVESQIVRLLAQYDRLLSWERAVPDPGLPYVDARVRGRRGMLQLAQARGETVSLEDANREIEEYLAEGNEYLDLEMAADLLSVRGKRDGKPVRLATVPLGQYVLRLRPAKEAGGKGAKGAGAYRLSVSRVTAE